MQTISKNQISENQIETKRILLRKLLSMLKENRAEGDKILDEIIIMEKLIGTNEWGV